MPRPADPLSLLLPLRRLCCLRLRQCCPSADVVVVVFVRGGDRPGGHGLPGGVLLLPVPRAADHRVPLRQAAQEGGGQVQEDHPEEVAPPPQEASRGEDEGPRHGLVGWQWHEAPGGTTGRGFWRPVRDQWNGVQRQRQRWLEGGMLRHGRRWPLEAKMLRRR